MWNIIHKVEHNLLRRALCALHFMYQEMLFLKITWSLNMDLVTEHSFKINLKLSRNPNSSERTKNQPNKKPNTEKKNEA